MWMGRIFCTQADLKLGITLNGGQSFRWFAHKNEQLYRGVFAGFVWSLAQKGDYLLYTVHNPAPDAETNYETILSKYFRLEIPLTDYLTKWIDSDPHFQQASDEAKGVRILHQDTVENLFSFICSSNNNISRITGMVRKLSKLFGKKLCEVEGEEFHDFPTVEELTGPNVEAVLRKEGFGYRAAYIANAAKKLVELGGREWLLGLCKSNNTSYAEARKQLVTLPGVGPKVADCVCLMSLEHLEAIPVDTHIFQVARTNYMPHLRQQKTVTPKIHEEVSKHLRELWGPLAGWAQAVIFCAKINNVGISSNDLKRSSLKDNLKVEGDRVKTRRKR